MQEADYAMTQRAIEEQDRFRGDENLYVMFYKGAVEDRKMSLEHGRPMYRDTEFVRIMVPGDKGNIIEREIRDVDKRRFPKQYQAYKNEEQEYETGTPLDKWNYVSPAQIEELKYFGIRTVEALANVSDGNAQKFIGINKLRRKAREFIDVTSNEAPIAQLQDELEKRDLKIQEQDEVIASFQQRLAALEGNEPTNPEEIIEDEIIDDEPEEDPDEE